MGWDALGRGVRDVGGTSTLIALSFVAYFGLLPTLWFAELRLERRPALLRAGAFVAGLVATSLVAADLWRFVAFLLVPLYTAGLRVLALPRALWWIVALGAATGPLIALQQPVLFTIVEAMMRHEPRQVQALVTDVVPEFWYVFFAYASAFVGMAYLSQRIVRSGRAPDANAPA